MKKLYLLFFILMISAVIMACVQNTYLNNFTKYDKETQGRIDKAVSSAILSQCTSYGEGDTCTEGHIILSTAETNEKLTVYTIASFSAYGFVNGAFTDISGSGAIPTVIVLRKDAGGNYAFLEYKEPKDGSLNLESRKELFPSELWERISVSDLDYPELKRQQIEQAKAYLKSIGSDANISAD